MSCFAAHVFTGGSVSSGFSRNDTQSRYVCQFESHLVQYESFVLAFPRVIARLTLCQMSQRVLGGWGLGPFRQVPGHFGTTATSTAGFTWMSEPETPRQAKKQTTKQSLLKEDLFPWFKSGTNIWQETRKDPDCYGSSSSWFKCWVMFIWGENK